MNGMAENRNVGPVRKLKVPDRSAPVHAGLFLIAFAGVFTSCLNPFGLRGINTDTSVYLTVAQGIIRGQVPFRDFFDNKGPLLYLASAPGMLFGGLAGVWVTELLFMYTSVLFAYKTARFFGDKLTAFLGVACAFIIFQSFFYGVAGGTEEYSLPFMMISLYIFTKYFFTQREPPACELAILGMCFASAVLIRINHFPLWMGFCAVIAAETLLKKRRALVLKYILCFGAGVLAAGIPVFAWLAHNGALSGYVSQNLLSGGSRAFSGFSVKDTGKFFLAIMYKNFCFMPLVAGFMWLAKKPRRISIAYSAGFLLSYLLTVLFLAVIRSDFGHYNLMLVPFLVPAFCFSVELCFAYFAASRHKKIIVMLFAVLVFSKEILTWAYNFYEIAAHKDKARLELAAAGKTIDRETKPGDTVISLGHSCQIYLFTGRQSASRWIYQTSGADFAPDMREEFLADMAENSPEIIAIKNENGSHDYLPDWYAPVYRMIERGYRLLSDENGWFLFIRQSARN